MSEMSASVSENNSKTSKAATNKKITKKEQPKRDTAKGNVSAKSEKNSAAAKSPKNTTAKSSKSAKSSTTKSTKESDVRSVKDIPAEKKAKKDEPKKTPPKKTDTKPKAKSTTRKEADIKTEVSSKTPQVMKLVEQKHDMVNPTILAGKSSIPRKLRGLEPLSRIMRRELEGDLDPDEELLTYNVTALVIDDNAREILRRFNACDCEICVEEFSRLTAEMIPARFAKLRKSAVERNAPEVEDLKEPLKRKVTSEMIRLVIRNKKRSYHD